MFDMLEYYHMLKNSNVSIIYSGLIWADGVEGIAGTLRKRLELDNLPLSASQCVFSVFVEQMNNMLHYSQEKQYFEFAEKQQLSASSGVFLLGIHEKSYFLQSGNVMAAANIPSLKAKIDYLNTLDKAELRKYYKEQLLLGNKNPDSREIGLGLIEIARRATSKIEYRFTPIPEDSAFFAMYVEIGK